MINENLTDEDVVEGLERCISTTTDKACAGCPFNKQNLCDIDQWALERYALDLIKRQKSEIERLKSANDEKFRQWDMLAEKTKTHYADLYNEAKDKLKAEAYKEFAERLKRSTVMAVMGNKIYAVATSKGVDNLLKEMVGEEE
jgi:hypothetical protein